jgi:hypothetical protein
MQTTRFPMLAALVSLPRITGFKDPKALREYLLITPAPTAERLRDAWTKDYARDPYHQSLQADEYQTLEDIKIEAELMASERLRDATAPMLEWGYEYADYVLSARVWYHACYGAWRGDHNRT